MRASTTSRPVAVIFDLFGTLVAAPSLGERSAAARRFAEDLRVSPAVAESALTGSWRPRHDGQLKSTAEVAAHLAVCCDVLTPRANDLERSLARLAGARLQPDTTLLHALGELRHGGAKLAVLSDASPDIAEAWSQSDLAPYFDAAVFSCVAGAVKPAPELFRQVLAQLGITSHQALYCGDGGGDELIGAEGAGMRALRVLRRGGPAGLAFGETAWSGTSISKVEDLPSLLSGWTDR